MIVSTFISHILDIQKLYEINSLSTVLELPVLKGLDGIEGDTKILKLYDKHEIKSIFDAHGLTVPCIYHETRCDGIFGEAREALKDELKRQLEVCAFFGSPIIMAVPCCVETPTPERVKEKMAEYFRVCAELSQKYGIKTVAENYSTPKYTFATIEDTEWYLNALPEVDFVLDTGNYFFTYSDPLSACERFLPRIAHVHAKDIKEMNENPYAVLLGRGYDSVAVGEGDVPIYEIVNKLKSSGYRGAFSIEISSMLDLAGKMRRSIDNLKSLIK